MTPEEQVARAQRADMLLKDDLFKEAIDKLHKGAIESFKGAKTNEEFYKARALYEVTENFMNAFVSVIRDGQMAQHRLLEIEKLKKPPVKPRDKFVPRHAQF